MSKNTYITNNTSILIALALVLSFLYWARVIVIPVALSILLTFLLSPIVTWLHQHSIPRVVAVLLASSLALGAIGGAMWGVTNQMGSLLDSYPQYENNILLKINKLTERERDGLLEKLQAVTERITKQVSYNQEDNLSVSINTKDKINVQSVRIVDDGPFQLSQLWGVFGSILEPLANAGLIIVLVCFMLLNREDLRDRVISLIGVEQIAHTTRAFEDAGERVSRYLLMQLLINLGYGVAVGLGLWLIGVPYAPLWGFFGAVLRYIPYLGAWLSAILPIMLSLLISPGWSLAIMVIALFCVLELITNMAIEPMVYGRGIGVSQAALLICVAFWTWLWGPIGLILASPMTVCIVVLGRHVPNLKFLDTLIGDRPPLAPEQRFYQRLLADDIDEASYLVEQELSKENNMLAKTLDKLAAPALSQARADLITGKIESGEQQRLIDNLQAIIDGYDKEIALEGQEDKQLNRKIVLAVPARDLSDELAIRMLTKSISDHEFEWHEMSSKELATEKLNKIGELTANIVVITSVYPSSLAHAVYLCKRIHVRFPEIAIIVCRLGNINIHAIRLNSDSYNKLHTAGANKVTYTLQETLLELNKLDLLDLPSAD